ncbi:MAG: acyl-CoA dehydrogenase family protein [Microthrixaceae bacterium]
MRFAPTTEQLEFAEAVKGLLADTCTPESVRSAWGGEVGEHTALGTGDGRIRAAWDALTEMGVLGLTVPESNGGLAMSDDDLVGIAIECGYAGLPDPLVATAGVAAGALRSIGGPSDVADDWLTRIANGASVVTGFGPDPVVSAASSSDGLLLFGHDPVSGAGEVGVRILEPGDVRLELLESVDGSRALCRVEAIADAGVPLADGEEARDIAAMAFDRAAVYDAALMVGLSRRMLDLTVEYVSERKQFGVPIGSFQAVKHHLANAGLEVEFAEPLVRNAAHLLASATPADRAVAVSMAKQRASLAAVTASETTLQCHGAIGYTVEADLHLFMKRSWALAHTNGDADWHRARVRSDLLGR